MPRPIHFEFSAENPDRAAKFYGDVFGWSFQKWEGPMPYWLIKTGEGAPGIDGGMMPRPADIQGTVNTVGVPSIEETLGKIEAGGGKVVMPPQEIPGVGRFAYCADTEGNVFGVIQPAQ